MIKNLVVVNTPSEWKFDLPDAVVVSAWDYLTDPQYISMPKVKVFNLCRSYQYQSYGYYVSLIAAARGHVPLPTVMTIQDMKSRAVSRVISSELEGLMESSLSGIRSDEFVLSIYFGKNLAKKYDRLSARLYSLFEAPMLRAQFVRAKGKWMLDTIGPISMKEVPEEHFDFIQQAAKDHFTKRRNTHKPKNYRFDMAILANPADPTPPSCPDAMAKFLKAADKKGINAEIIGKEDYHHLVEYDALFIRETTNVNHHTYRFSRKADAEGLVVIDDPLSILRCTNKVYLAELLTKKKIPAPKTVILHRQNMKQVPNLLPFPIILKQPDSSFSQGVVKVKNLEEYTTTVNALLEKSALIIAQEFMPTDFDWRVGLMNGEPLYVCRYFMSAGHWQIYNKGEAGELITGDYETIAVEQTPKEVLSIAKKAAECIGNGLYGVDIKQNKNSCCIIEVNDNPSIDADVEDAVMGNALYEKIMDCFLQRLMQKKQG